jgi:hypothetical protein
MIGKWARNVPAGKALTNLLLKIILTSMSPSVLSSCADSSCANSERGNNAQRRFTGLVGVFCIILLGCATNPSDSASEARMWRAQLERQQQGAREAGRIGYIGYAGPASN